MRWTAAVRTENHPWFEEGLFFGLEWVFFGMEIQIKGGRLYGGRDAFHRVGPTVVGLSDGGQRFLFGFCSTEGVVGVRRVRPSRLAAGSDDFGLAQGWKVVVRTAGAFWNHFDEMEPSVWGPGDT